MRHAVGQVGELISWESLRDFKITEPCLPSFCLGDDAQRTGMVVFGDWSHGCLDSLRLEVREASRDDSTKKRSRY